MSDGKTEVVTVSVTSKAFFFMLKADIQDTFCLQLNLNPKCCKCLKISDYFLGGGGEGNLHFDGFEIPH